MLPGFVDSHAHLVFAGDRAEEFAARMEGRPYSAGGIATTVAATREATDEALAANVARLVAEMARQGTTTVEIKSGYGLTTYDETRALAVARQFTEETTFLGAHVVPREYAEDVAAYVALVTGPMLEAAAPHARWIDVFCERGAFDADQARTILAAGRAGRTAAAGARQPARARPGHHRRVRGRAPPRPTTARSPARRTSPTSPTPASLRPCCRVSSSRRGRPTRTPARCSRPASPSRWPPTATPAPATRRRCRCASRWPSGRCG